MQNLTPPTDQNSHPNFSPATPGSQPPMSPTDKSKLKSAVISFFVILLLLSLAAYFFVKKDSGGEAEISQKQEPRAVDIEGEDIGLENYTVETVLNELGITSDEIAENIFSESGDDLIEYFDEKIFLRNIEPGDHKISVGSIEDVCEMPFYDRDYSFVEVWEGGDPAMNGYKIYVGVAENFLDYLEYDLGLNFFEVLKIEMIEDNKFKLITLENFIDDNSGEVIYKQVAYELDYYTVDENITLSKMGESAILNEDDYMESIMDSWNKCY